MFRRTMAAMMLGAAALVGGGAKPKRPKTQKHTPVDPSVGADFRDALATRDEAQRAQDDMDFGASLRRMHRQAQRQAENVETRKRNQRGPAPTGPIINGREVMRAQRRHIRMGTKKLRRRHHLGEFGARVRVVAYTFTMPPGLPVVPYNGSEVTL